jgi:Protein of unknown function (DUF3306)
MSADRPDPPDGSEPFLSRWSRRKQGAGRQEVSPAPSEGAATAPVATEPETAIDLTSLPRIEELTASSGVEAFLQKGVPEALKNLALRKAWSLDPAIRDFIEVAENQYDWNVPGGAPGYGDLNPGADMRALLDQAVGRVPDPPPEETSASSAAMAGDAAAGPPDALVARADERSELEAGAAPDTEANRVAVGAGAAGHVQASPDTAAAPSLRDPPVGRRRHGGALPSGESG